tara:strand:- start:3141 stop:3734 length:594 start_codon:yes stop_codon:yes gene_type:complete
MKPETAQKAKELFQVEREQVINEVKTINPKDVTIDHDQILNQCKKALESIHSIKLLNKGNKKLGLDFHINTDIFFTAINHCLSVKPFEENQMEAYYAEALKLENYVDTFGDIVDFDMFSISYELEFILLGVDFKKYSGLSENSKAHVCTYFGERRQVCPKLYDLNPQTGITQAIGISKEFLQPYGLILPGYEIEVIE